MAGENFGAQVNSIAELFAITNVYEIPYYQRPYVWDTEKVGQLFDDIYDHFEREVEDEYFLGCIVLAENEKSKRTQKYYDVIDGQQRIISLQLLLTAILLQLERNHYDNNKISKIRNPTIENEAEGHKVASRRIIINTSGSDNSYLQNLQTPVLIEDAINNMIPDSSASKHMQENIKWYLDNCLKEKFQTDCERLNLFAWHILDYCAVVRVETTNVQIAIGIFSTLNARGMALQDVDIIKAHVIAALEGDDRDFAIQQWQNMEDSLGKTEVLNDMFIQYRMEMMERKSSVALINDYYELIPGGDHREYLEFLHNLIRTTTHFVFVKNINDSVRDFFEDKDLLKKDIYAKDIYRMISFLNTHENSDWVPVVMCMKRHFDSTDLAAPDNTEYRKCFSLLLKKMEILATYFRFKKVGRSSRLTRYFKIIKEIKAINNETILSCRNVSALELTDDEKINFREMLDGPVYNLLGPVFTKYILIHLNQWNNDKNEPAYYDIARQAKITVEHVLPQNDADPYWQQNWTDADRKVWLHRIGNLCLISSSMNTANRNHAYDIKKSNTQRTGCYSNYNITRECFDYEKWTVKECQELHKKRMSILYKGWELE